MLEDLDYDDCLAKAQAIAGVSGKRPAGKMQAYVFIKPHAVTSETKKLVGASFAGVGVTVYKEGSLVRSTLSISRPLACCQPCRCRERSH